MNHGEIELEYAKLTREVARLFYGRKSVHALLLNLLTRHEWAKEELLAKELGLAPRQVHKVLRELQKDLIVSRVVLKDKEVGRFGSNSQSYCCLDYKSMVDTCRLKFHLVRRYLKGEEEESKLAVLVCPDCGKKYSALETSTLEVGADFMFLCEDCEATLEDGNQSDESGQKEKQKELSKTFEKELQPFGDLLNRLKPFPAPYFGTLQEWAQAQAKIREAKQNGDTDILDQAENLVIDIDIEEEGDDILEPTVVSKPKELPPWMRLGYQERGAPKIADEPEAKRAKAEDSRGSEEQPPAKRVKVEPEKPVKVEEVKVEENNDEEDDVEWEDI